MRIGDMTTSITIQNAKKYKNAIIGLIVVVVVLSVVSIIFLVFVIISAVTYGNIKSLFITAFSSGDQCTLHPDRCQYLARTPTAPITIPDTFSKPVGLFAAQSILNLEYAVDNYDANFVLLSPLELIGNIVIPSEAGKKGKTANFGYVAIDRSARILYIFYRGTMSSYEWKFDLNYKQTAVTFLGSEFDGSLIHSGFADVLTQIQPRLASLITPELANFDSVLVSGHSLGSAVASLTASYLISNLLKTASKTIFVYAFGKPRVGNITYCDVVQTLFGARFSNVANECDIVPDLPFAVTPAPKGVLYIFNTEGTPIYYQKNYNAVRLNHGMTNYIHFLLE